MEAVLHSIAHPIALAIQAVAIAFVTAGSALALVKAARMLIVGKRSTGEFQAIWLNHARWLVAGLTFLSYFLDREMEYAERPVPRSATEIQG